MSGSWPQSSPGVGVVGAGQWGRNLVRVFHGLGALRAVCSRDAAHLERAREACPGVFLCANMDDLLARPDVRAVAVATPSETHYALARQALLAGKHALVEKPLTLREEDARELVALARERGLTLMVGHLLHYHPAFERLKALCAAGELGRIDYIYSHRLNLGRIRREENILWSFAPHDISMILALAGAMPQSLLATGGSWLQSAIADVTVTQMDFASGLKGHIFVSWLHPYKEQRLVVVGQGGMAVFDDGQPWEDKLLLYPHEIRWDSGAPVPVKAEAVRVDVAPGEPLLRECEHFLECVATGARPRTDGKEGLRVLTVLGACQRSLNAAGVREAIGEAR
ncbi:Gfo/Idh/MocA family protein [Fundidesulfovibrio soli]|uniref:Gfo/Idh/MocA family protein n=1 Tax=Fundidesulfovibrio soli TaxID=2922716 RepID=UPI001FAEFE2F|nr:Gfo/Idh/MocA family oxidoreductase [Fundidesulfovibrio soli]